MDSKLLRLISHQSFFSTVNSGDLEALKLTVEGSGGNEGDNRAAWISALMALRNDAGETAIYIAADNNLVDIFNYLIKFCDLQMVMIRSKSDMNAFHAAAWRGNLAIVKELLSMWPELCRSCDSSDTSPLYSAAKKNHLDVVNAILDADAGSIRIVRKNGKTSLHNAARYGPPQIVKTLIDKDPGIVSIQDKKGQTALHMAVKGQDPSIVEEILFADLSILNARDKKGNTAVHIATRKCRPEILSLLLSYDSIEVNAINKQNETALDLAEKLQYGEPSLAIREVLVEVGAKNARNVGRVDETMELKRTVSDIKHEVQSQFIQNAKTNKRMSGIAKELRKLHREAVQNTTNSVTVVAVLFASIAFVAIFNLPGQYFRDGSDVGKARIADTVGFRVFCLLNATSLFISLAVVVVQITLIAWDTRSQKQVVSVVNKLMWAACLTTCGSFLSLAFVVVGKKRSWMAITITLIGAPILLVTLAFMCYFVLRQHFNIFGDDSHRRIRRASFSKSFSWSPFSPFSDPDALNSDHEKIYAL
ncbi:PREDICTED: ankyrin repeat-containing protein At2g01680-like [Nelumbo nucifera]|uniref:Ankyrin repeat-containing protein At2g01680-like n=1 Tax=Nelumbo nucifera TaxID=4432 RepID=A0A1U8B5A2_NELNU|nr:PREDICTED: ankyrin repeat-containing protein At2g01680-like [Nelumbo nucifera]